MDILGKDGKLKRNVPGHARGAALLSIHTPLRGLGIEQAVFITAPQPIQVLLRRGSAPGLRRTLDV